MKEYILFLDESKQNKEIPYFCLGGCIVEKNNYINNVIPFVNHLKHEIFDNPDVILHESEIRTAKGIYVNMRNPQKRDSFWNQMSTLFLHFDITTLGVVFNMEEYQRMYSIEWGNSEYAIALQIVLENFLHFLITHEGIGKIYIESRNNVEDKKLQHQFYALVSNGSLLYKNDCFQNLLSTISFPIKEENNIGLQIADFVPNVLKKKANNLPQRKPSLQSDILQCLYGGSINEKSRFGMKVMP